MTNFKCAAVAIALLSLFTVSAFAQPVAASGQPDAGEGYQQASANAAVKVERKRQRKAARARKNAELKKLESNGYHPGQSDPNYPQNLQKAQKRADPGAAPAN